jgi:hypothetical protein
MNNAAFARERERERDQALSPPLLSLPVSANIRYMSSFIIDVREAVNSSAFHYSGKEN